MDNLKTSKDSNTSFKARRAIRKIKGYPNDIVFDLKRDIDEGLNFGDNKYNTNDDIIVSCAKRYNAYIMTEDFNLCIKAKAIGVEIIEIVTDDEKYCGFSEIIFSDEMLANFYQNQDKNEYNLKCNEYIAVKDKSGDIIDVRKWNGEKYTELYNKRLSTSFFGDKFRPLDCYQRMVIDSIMTNTITAISGEAGTGKSLLALVCSMKLIESGKYDRLTVLFNPTKTRGASDMGYYSGSQVEKALQNSIGNMFTSKFVDEATVMQLIRDNKLRLVSMADARGMEISDTDILYITEAQNTSTDLMKLCLTRPTEKCKIIIEGDYSSQVDSYNFEGENNGMLSVINKLSGEDIFGLVELQTIYRSRLASLIASL